MTAILLEQLDAHGLPEDTVRFGGGISRTAIIEYDKTTSERFSHALEALKEQERCDEIKSVFSDILENHILFLDMLDSMTVDIPRTDISKMSQRIVHYTVSKALKKL